MLQKLFPKENSSLKALSAMANSVADSAALLSEMVGSTPDVYPGLLDQMLEHESQVQDQFFTTLTTVRSSFASPIPREDLYIIASSLNNAVEKLTSAGNVLALHKIDRFTPHATTLLDIIQREAMLTSAIIPRLEELRGLDQYWIDMLRITKQATRTAQAYDAEILGQYKTDRYLKIRKFITEVTAASDAMRAVSGDIGRIIVQES